MKEKVIPQSLLSEYADCDRRVKAAKSQRLELRKQILQLASEGARAERGSLDCIVKRTPSKAVRKHHIVALIGLPAYESLRASVEPSTQEKVQVFEVPMAIGCKLQPARSSGSDTVSGKSTTAYSKRVAS